MEIRRIIILASFSLAVSGCDQWPPYQNELRENFTNNREAFDTLKTKIQGTEYIHVSMTGIYGIPRFDDSTYVVANTQGEEYIEQEIIEDDPEWNDLFLAANVFAVAQHEDVVSLRFVGPLEDDKRTTFAEYVYDAAGRESRKTCLPEYEDLRCGLCAVDLADNWYIDYWWSPEELVLGGYDRVLDDEMTNEQYRETFDRNLEQCRFDGYTAIGYDLPEKPEASQ